MRRHTRRRSRSENGSLLRDGIRQEHEYQTLQEAEVVRVHRDIQPTDTTAMGEGDAIIRRGKSASGLKAWHDSILWNSNVRKTWIRYAIELGWKAERLRILRGTA